MRNEITFDDDFFGEAPSVPAPPKSTVHLTPMNAPKKAVEVKSSAAPIGKIELYEWQDSHFYKINGEYYPSVTTILSVIRLQFLEQWRGNVGNEEAAQILKRTSEDGSAAHNIFSRMLLEGKQAVFGADVNPSTEIMVPNQFVHLALHKLTQFWKIVSPELIQSEIRLFSPAHEFAGTADLILRIKGGSYPIAGAKDVYLTDGIWLADIKTGKNISELSGLQLAAYTMAIEETRGLKIEGAMILHTQATTKNGIEGFTVKVWDRDELEKEFRVFKAAQVLYNYKKPYKPKDINLPTSITLE